MGWAIRGAAAAIGALFLAGVVLWVSGRFAPGAAPVSSLGAMTDAEAVAALTPENVNALLESDLAAIRAAIASAPEAELPGLLRHQDRLLRQLSRPAASAQEIAALRETIAAVLDDHGRTLDAASLARLAAGEVDAARPALLEARAEAEAALRLAARTAHALGLLALRDGDPVEAAGFLIRAAELDARTAHLREAERVARQVGNLAAALAFGPPLLAAVRADHGEGSAELAEAQAQVAQTLLAADRREEAEALLREAVATGAASVAVGAGQAQRLNNLAAFLHGAGRLEEAEALYRDALALDESEAPDADSAARTGNLATLLLATGRVEEGLAFRARASALARSTLRADHPDLALHLAAEADALRGAGQGGRAVALYQEAAGALRAALGPRHPDLTARLDALAGALRASGGLTEAEALYREVLERTGAGVGPAHADYGRALNNLGLVLRDAGRLPEAETSFREAIAVLTTALGPDHGNVAVVQANLASMLP
jgi:tetratricopeptide (TPR) repeat protein